MSIETEHSSTILKENLSFYNTLARQEQPFIPLSPTEVGLYTCGPTVYSRAHIGNFRTNIFADTVRRVLERSGYNVKHVMNITDVGHLTSDADVGEDKLEKSAKLERATAWQIATKYTQLWLQDRNRLGLGQPTVLCKATDYIPEQVALVKRLEDKGFTYVTSDGVYFDTSKLDDYGKLARLDVAGLSAGIRIDMRGKKSPTDFALWKFSDPQTQRDMEWDSPWGKGFPGWHIECSAMSMAHLGPQFDIHTGGVDLIPIHHTNEIAQSEASTGLKPFVRYWLHSEFLTIPVKTVEGETQVKMSKSTGNIMNLDELEAAGIPALAYKYFCLTAKYGQKLSISEDSFKSAASSYGKLMQIMGRIIENSNPDILGNLSAAAIKYVSKFDLALGDNLNTPVALSVLWTVVRDQDLNYQEKFDLSRSFDQALGLNLTHPSNVDLLSKIPATVNKLLAQRQEMKKIGKWAEADNLRSQINELGYSVIDTPQGPKLIKK